MNGNPFSENLRIPLSDERKKKEYLTPIWFKVFKNSKGREFTIRRGEKPATIAPFDPRATDTRFSAFCLREVGDLNTFLRDHPVKYNQQQQIKRGSHLIWSVGSWKLCYHALDSNSRPPKRSNGDTTSPSDGEYFIDVIDALLHTGDGAAVTGDSATVTGDGVRGAGATRVPPNHPTYTLVRSIHKARDRHFYNISQCKDPALALASCRYRGKFTRFR
jgi:hypothetical protein